MYYCLKLEGAGVDGWIDQQNTELYCSSLKVKFSVKKLSVAFFVSSHVTRHSRNCVFWVPKSIYTIRFHSCCPDG